MVVWFPLEEAGEKDKCGQTQSQAPLNMLVDLMCSVLYLYQLPQNLQLLPSPTADSILNSHGENWKEGCILPRLTVNYIPLISSWVVCLSALCWGSPHRASWGAG